jgi:hypothetical protein
VSINLLSPSLLNILERKKQKKSLGVWAGHGSTTRDQTKKKEIKRLKSIGQVRSVRSRMYMGWSRIEQGANWSFQTMGV